MKKILLFFTMFASIVLMSACEDNENASRCTCENGFMKTSASQTICNGYINKSHESFENLTVNGTAKLEDVILHNEIIVNGTLQGTNIEVNGKLTINGSVELHNSKIQGAATIVGSMTARKCTFNTLQITTKKLVLRDCSTEAITIKKNTSFLQWPGQNDNQYVELDNTIVNGTITFESGKGVVIIKNNALVKGKIIGGILG